jgi:hypothetical protein
MSPTARPPGVDARAAAALGKRSQSPDSLPVVENQLKPDPAAEQLFVVGGLTFLDRISPEPRRRALRVRLAPHSDAWRWLAGGRL